MAKKEVPIQAVIEKQRKELLTYLMKKTKTTHKTIVEMAEEDFISANIALLSAKEKKQFDKLVLE